MPVVTSTITVSGVDPYLWDLDVTTFLMHNFNSDLSVTLMSPGGTIVTLTSGNGGMNSNVFNGTLWDDQANPGGIIPYTNNDGVVADTLFVNGVTANPLTPEEPLGAFIGENPNGVWTLTISDRKNGDGGFLNSWRLDVTTLPAAPQESISMYDSAPAIVIEDNMTYTTDIAASGHSGIVCKVRVFTQLPHTFPGDLVIGLTSPAGTIVTLTSQNGENRVNVYDGTQWDDDANPGGQVPYMTNDGVVTDHNYVSMVVATPLTPQEAFAAFNGENPNGIWTLTIGDLAGGDTGTLDMWSLEITTCSYGDADADGVGDPCDQCAGGNDGVDSDADGIPDACDSCGACGAGGVVLMPLTMLGIIVMPRTRRFSRR